MILSAMIFAGLTMIVGFLIGFLLGQARSRMSYEEDLHKVEQARASLDSELAGLRKSIEMNSQPQGQPSGAEPARGPSE
jgi:predicted histidine transporter YuiF (NhaC family)